MTGTAQNDPTAHQLFAASLAIKVLLVCAAVVLLFFGLAAQAGAKPAPPSGEATAVAAPAPRATVQVAYDDASCSTCHYSDIQKEHQTRGGCTLCHKNDTYTSTVTIKKMAGKKGCGVDNNGCHSASSKSPWHGGDPARVSAAHAVSVPTVLPDAGSSAVSCAGDGAGASCHANGSTQSGFFFGTMDLASAHADYSSAVKNGLTNPAIKVATSPAFMSTVDSCGVCHDKASTEPYMLKKTAADLIVPARQARDFSCLTCHNSANTYVAADAYPDELKALYPGKSLCFAADPQLLTPEPAPVVVDPVLPPAADSQPTTSTTDSSLGSLLGQLSPDLKAQLSGVAPVKQQPLTAGVLAPDGSGIPASALPATSISNMTLFK